MISVRPPSERVLDVAGTRDATSVERFLDLLRDLGGVDVDLVARTIRAQLHYRKLRSAVRAETPPDPLEARWYASLDAGAPDYGVYADDRYFADLWACWLLYSRRYVQALRKPGGTPLGSVRDQHIGGRCVVDLGCGIGYSSALLAETFPTSDVIATNLDGTAQSTLARLVAERAGGGSPLFSVVGDLAQIERPVELVFASEYFEHFVRPIEHLVDVLTLLRPRALAIANTFTQRSIGHFDAYDLGSTRGSGHDAARAFSRTLRRFGYHRVPTSFWNGRSQYWARG